MSQCCFAAYMKIVHYHSWIFSFNIFLRLSNYIILKIVLRSLLMNKEDLMPWNWFKKSKPQFKSQNGMLRKLHHDIDRFFEGVWEDFHPTTKNGGQKEFFPKIDLVESDTEYKITAETPGVNEKDINVEVRNDTVIISGEKKISQEKKNENYHYSECSYGSFSRAFSLPKNVNADKIEAGFDKGVMTVVMPKKERTKSKSLKIKVKS